jgi:hypothetical protein
MAGRESNGWQSKPARSLQICGVGVVKTKSEVGLLELFKV